MGIVYVKSTTSTVHNGIPIRLVEGEVWDADDPLVAAHGNLFADEPTKVRRTGSGVEQATAAPGEKRRKR